MEKNVEVLINEFTKLSNYDFTNIVISSDLGSVTFELMYSESPESHSIITLQNVIQMSFSRTPDTEQLGFYIGEIKIVELHDGGQEILKKLNHLFVESNGEDAQYKNLPLFHLHSEGEVCFDIICSKIIFKRGEKELST